MTRRGLGKGLDALLTSTEGESSGLREVPIDSLSPNPYQPRRQMAPEALEELTASIKAHGLLQPLVVRAHGGGYQVIAGERRWLAARAAGLTHVPVVVRQADARQMLALAIVENVQRAELDPIETAGAYRKLMDEFSLTQEDVAELVGKSRAAVANSVRLLGLAEEVRGLVAQGHLSEGHARSLLTLRDKAEQAKLARRCVAGAWTVRRLEDEVRRPVDGAAPVRKAVGGKWTVDPDTASALGQLEAVLETRVELRRTGKGGQIVIHFYSDEELAAIYDRLVGRRR